MKKILFILMAFMASFSAYAQDINTMKEVKPLTVLSSRATYTVLGTASVSLTSLTLPWTFSVPAPLEDVVEVYGPTGPNTSYWTVQNGNLFITITGDAAPEILFPQSVEFVVRTKNSTLYSVILTII